MQRPERQKQGVLAEVVAVSYNFTNCTALRKSALKYKSIWSETCYFIPRPMES